MGLAGLVMAGGAGTRMQKSGVSSPKPLVVVRGVTLLERNILALLRAGITEIHVAISAAAKEVEEFTQARCVAVAEALGAKLSVIKEHEPLGSIGAAAFLKDRTELVVVNSDNLTNLDLRAMLNAHQTSRAAMTIAVHDQGFRIPFGEVATVGDQVVAYREKPTLNVTVCSALTIMNSLALAYMVPGEALGLPAFVNRILGKKIVVHSFKHNAAWIDVNDSAAVEMAEALIGDDPEHFEMWSDAPDDEITALLIHGRSGIVLEQNDNGLWSLPRLRISNGIAYAPMFPHGIEVAAEKCIAILDDVDIIKRRIIRARVISIDVDDRKPAGRQSCFREDEIHLLAGVAPIVPRALAAKARIQLTPEESKIAPQSTSCPWMPTTSSPR